ncbi:MAG: GAF and ANTAR domain-containing protein [Hamadaea sp.]|nr:GAF and ANTAR domain-containing protein [Hamadaea sp.]
MLLTSFAQLAQQLFGADDLTQALPAVLKHTVGVVTGCDWAAITLIARDGQPTTVASGPIAAELDELQFATGIGPSIIALGSDGPVIVPDLHHASRWPVLAATATQLGAASALCHGLFTHHPGQWTKLGTLTLYGESTQAFSDDDQEFAAILAAFIAVIATLVQRRDDVDRREAALHRALSTRDVIGQAKGILMERQHLSAGDAFDLLRRASQRLNRRLADIAGHLAETGELPT